MVVECMVHLDADLSLCFEKEKMLAQKPRLRSTKPRQRLSVDPLPISHQVSAKKTRHAGDGKPPAVEYLRMPDRTISIWSDGQNVHAFAPGIRWDGTTDCGAVDGMSTFRCWAVHFSGLGALNSTSWRRCGCAGHP
jgi:hypothetical protein